MSGPPPGRRASPADLLGWRMRALGLWQTLPGAEGGVEAGRGSGAATDAGRVAEAGAGPGSEGPRRIRAVAERLLAMQGQDWNAARWALGVRAPGTTDADVVAAFDSGELVRSWPMRGTIHVVAAEDIGWMQAATNHRVLPGAAKRRQFIGLDDESLARMTDVAVERLTGGRSISREELATAWADAGIGDPEKGVGPWRYHVVWWLCQNGITVPGPVGAAEGERTREPRLVLAEEWIRSPRRLEGEEALAELAARFALGRGPVQDRDLAWWTGLTLREARSGIAAAESDGRLAPVEIEGARYWADPELLDGPSGLVDDALLLPGFDEHLLGYTDRSAVLDDAHFERIVPGRNGMFRSTVVLGGRVAGVWLRTPHAKRVRIEIEPLPGSAVAPERLRAPAEAWGAFRGVDVEIEVAAGD